MALTLVEGQTLNDYLIDRDRLNEAQAAHIAQQIALGLDHAHNHGTIHRDVKPSNILLTKTGRAMLSDFGVALILDDPNITHSDHLVGTPAHLAPEQIRDKRAVDGRADLYALGAVLYRMVTGRTPFQGSMPQLLFAHVYDPRPDPSQFAPVSPEMQAIIMKALRKEATDRYESGAKMAEALAQLGHARDATTQTLMLPRQSLIERYRAIVILSGIVLFIGLLIMLELGG